MERTFCEKVLLKAGLATDLRLERSNARRNENREALRAIIVETFGAPSTAQVQIANARMNVMAGPWAYPRPQAATALAAGGLAASFATLPDTD
jgi:crotonobetainyl-CoA:carnitine CoA-transferase CaiB-like acyl-CoA transferase